MFAFRALTRKRKIWLVAFGMSVVTALPVVAADVNLAKYQWPLAPTLQGNPLDYPLLGYHFGIVDDFTQGAGGEASSFITVPGSLQPLCSGFDDPVCLAEIATGKGWGLNAILPPCSTVSADTYCIEGVRVTDSEGSRELKLKQILSGPTWNADANHGSIPGSSPSLWIDPNEKDATLGYKVTAGGQLIRTGVSPMKSVNTRLISFQSNVTAYKEISGNFKGYSPITGPNGVTHPGWGGGPGCIWSEKAVCGVQTDYKPGSRLQLRVHLPSGLASWLIGRMSDPDISVTRINGQPDIQIVSVEANPILVPVFSVDLPIEKVNQSFKDSYAKADLCNVFPYCSHGYVGGNIAASYPSAFTAYEFFQDYLDQKSNLMIPTWSVRTAINNSSTPPANCGSGTSLFRGLVTTNASIYEGIPPKWDGSSLNYKVAGLHLDPEGNVFQGSYDLIMNSQYARCLYKFSDAPISATVSVIDSKGVNAIATTSFQEKDGWVHMAARGFTFSSPTLKVVLQQSNPEPKPVPSTSPSSAPTPEVVPTPVIAKSDTKVVSITCAKGKTVKKVTGVAPKCPAGYTVKKK